MTLLIENYGVIGNNATAALVGINGSIDWLCFPRFDSAACYAAILGTGENGHWSISPKSAHPKVTRRYRDGTLVLEIEFSMPEGTVPVFDCMDRLGPSEAKHSGISSERCQSSRKNLDGTPSGRFPSTRRPSYPGHHCRDREEPHDRRLRRAL
jgi:GH15 family glucan-1,4-alpha-glucosidase